MDMAALRSAHNQFSDEPVPEPKVEVEELELNAMAPYAEDPLARRGLTPGQQAEGLEQMEALIANPPGVTYLLDEEGEAPQIVESSGHEELVAGDPMLRRLRALAGAGNPFVFVVVDTEANETHFTYLGFYPQDLTAALREMAELAEAIPGE
jgi:hypothetical protein